jgi:hypothetical protein
MHRLLLSILFPLVEGDSVDVAEFLIYLRDDGVEDLSAELLLCPAIIYGDVCFPHLHGYRHLRRDFPHSVFFAEVVAGNQPPQLFLVVVAVDHYDGIAEILQELCLEQERRIEDH